MRLIGAFIKSSGFRASVVASVVIIGSNRCFNTRTNHSMSSMSTTDQSYASRSPLNVLANPCVQMNNNVVKTWFRVLAKPIGVIVGTNGRDSIGANTTTQPMASCDPTDGLVSQAVLTEQHPKALNSGEGMVQLSGAYALMGRLLRGAHCVVRDKTTNKRKINEMTVWHKRDNNYYSVKELVEDGDEPDSKRWLKWTEDVTAADKKTITDWIRDIDAETVPTGRSRRQHMHIRLVEHLTTWAGKAGTWFPLTSKFSIETRAKGDRPAPTSFDSLYSFIKYDIYFKLYYLSSGSVGSITDSTEDLRIRKPEN